MQHYCAIEDRGHSRKTLYFDDIMNINTIIRILRRLWKSAVIPAKIYRFWDMRNGQI